MPQMSPMSWEMLFMMFIMLFMMTNIMIYWIKESKSTYKSKVTKTSTNMNWKW